MHNPLEKYRNTKLDRFVQTHKHYLPVLFFVGGFIFDSLTLGRIDRVYDQVVLCLYMAALTLVVYLFNIKGSRPYKNTFFERIKIYLPLVIQFFFGGLSSAFVVYFSRSVSLSKTLVFFVLLVGVFIANEVFKKRISNRYLQFGFYYFINFTFFIFMLPVFIKQMNTFVFILSGIVSLGSTIALLIAIAQKNQHTLPKTGLQKLFIIVGSIYILVNVAYFTNIIPPVPLSLNTGIVAHQVERVGTTYKVTYERDKGYMFWRDSRFKFIHRPGERVYVFTSIFAPTAIKKRISHRWSWYNSETNDWEVVDNIGYKIIGGRDDGYRGYTYKDHLKPGLWRVDVITEEGRIIGVLKFDLIEDPNKSPQRLVEKLF